MFIDNREYKILYEVGNQSCKLIFLIKVLCVKSLIQDVLSSVIKCCCDIISSIKYYLQMIVLYDGGSFNQFRQNQNVF